jgi:hypothetical protein
MHRSLTSHHGRPPQNSTSSSSSSSSLQYALDHATLGAATADIITATGCGTAVVCDMISADSDYTMAADLLPPHLLDCIHALGGNRAPRLNKLPAAATAAAMAESSSSSSSSSSGSSTDQQMPSCYSPTSAFMLQRYLTVLHNLPYLTLLTKNQ